MRSCNTFNYALHFAIFLLAFCSLSQKNYNLNNYFLNLNWLLFTGIPILALTGTADSKMTKIVKQQLALQKDCLSIVLSPERFNIRHSIINSTRQNYMNHFQWIVDMVIEKGLQTPKTIIFCNSLKDVALMVSFMFEKLGCKLYPPEHPELPVHRLVGIYHSHTLQKYKDRVVDAFKHNIGNLRVIVATSALSMGVNFPDVVYVVHAGPPRALVDHIQEAGRAGRNGNKAHDITIYHGQQLAQCEMRVKEFVKSNECLRVKMYGEFYSATKPLEPLHDCCSNCASNCSCELPNCHDELPFSKPCGHISDKQHSMKRVISAESRQVFREALVDLKGQFDKGQLSVFDSVSTHGFSESLINSLALNCEYLFTLTGLMDDFPLYSVTHGIAILEVLDELFEDIPGVEELLEILKYFEESTFHIPSFDLFSFTDQSDPESDIDSS